MTQRWEHHCFLLEVGILCNPASGSPQGWPQGDGHFFVVSVKPPMPMENNPKVKCVRISLASRLLFANTGSVMHY